MNLFWKNLFNRHRDTVIHQWHQRLKIEISPLYAQRPEGELLMTVGMAFDSFSRVITFNRFMEINQFIKAITRIRLDAGFPLDDVQRSFELFRTIMTPILVEESSRERLCTNLQTVNKCLAYTIHRFSHYFQAKHELHLRHHAQRLEQAVQERTAELKDSEHKYRTLVEEIQDGYLVLKKGMIEFINPAFCKMHGYQPHEMKNRPFLDFISSKNRQLVIDTLDKDISPDPSMNGIVYFRKTESGKSLPTEITFTPSFFKGKKRYFCIVRDITQRVKMEKMIRDNERMAYIGKVTTSLSHEIRNPLSSVKMNLQILSQNKSFQGNDRRRIEISEQQIMRLEKILQELLDYAKPISLQFSSTRINEVVTSCMELLDVKFRHKKIGCNMVLDPDMPLVMTDENKIEQLIINLLLNAIESTDRNGCVTITTAKVIKENKTFSMIRVDDTGNGIPKNLLPNVFNPFYTTKAAGTGLGLANVKRIVNAHKGMINIHALPDAGTGFEVLIPMGREPSNG